MSKYQWFVYGLIAFSLPFFSFLHADEVMKKDYLQFKYLTIEDGLSNNKVNAICQDTLGFIWIGTDEGLNKYDGYTTTIYQSDTKDSNSISSSTIFSLHCDLSNNLWIGLNTGLNRYDTGRNVFIKHTYNSEDITQIRDFYEDEEGRIWVCSLQGLFIIHPDDFTITAYSDENPEFNLIQIYSFYIDSNKNKWIGTSNSGLYYIKAGSNKLNLITQTSNYRIEALAQDNGNYIWAGTSTNNLIRMSIDDFTMKSFVVDENNEYTERIRAIYIDSSGNMWLGTRGGLYLKPSEKDIFIQMGHKGMSVSKLSHNSIFSMYIDSFDVLWLGTYAGGVNFADLQQKKFMNLVKDDYDNSKGLNNDITFSMIEDNSNNIWIGTEFGGISQFNIKNGLFGSYFFDYKNEKKIINNAHAFAFSGSDQLWVGTYGYGLISFDIKKKSSDIFNIECSTCNDDANNVYALLSDSKDSLWVGTEQGLFYKKSNCENCFNRIDTVFPYDKVSVIFEDSKSNLWIGTQNNGLFFYNRIKYYRIAPERIKEINSILEDTNGNIWCGGHGNGLLVITNDTIVYYNNRDGIPNNTVLGILEDDSKNIWLSTSSGILKFNNAVVSPIVEKPDFRTYNTNDGLTSSQFNTGSCLKGSDGKLYFGNIKGVTYFDPNEIKDNDKLPKVVISKLSILNNPILPNIEYNHRLILSSDISITKNITLTSKDYVFSLEFASLQYASPQNNKYKYMLEGFDEDWTYTDANRRFATYTNLPGGTYVFKVYGTNNDGKWSKYPAQLTIKIVPPFWKTTLFIIIIILFGFSLITGYYLHRLRTIRLQKKKLGELVEIRTHELEDKNRILEKQTTELSETNRLLEESNQEIEMQSEELLVQKEQLIIINKQLEEVNTSKTKFFSIIGHDLKNPFINITGFAELLQKKFDYLTLEKKLQYINIIVTSAKHTSNLLDNLLTWARSQSNKIEFNPLHFSMGDLIKENLMLMKPNWDKKNISVTSQLNYINNVFADRNMIDSVIRNLITNAIKYTPNGGKIDIHTYLEKNKLIFVISDSGIGMNADQVHQLFKIENEISRKGTDGETGTGLGLILCKEFMDKNRGEIWVESETQKGSSFYIAIPVDDAT